MSKQLTSSVDDDSGFLLAVLVDPLGVLHLQSDAAVGKVRAEPAVLNYLLAVRLVENRVEVVFVLDSGRVPDRVSLLFSEVRYLAADLECALYRWSRSFARRALPVVLEVPLALLALVNADSVLRTVDSDQVLCVALCISDLVPHGL